MDKQPPGADLSDSLTSQPAAGGGRVAMIRALFDQYIEWYAARDLRLTGLFSENFTGIAGSAEHLVTRREEWVTVTHQDFSQVRSRIGIEMLDLALQDLADDVVVATAFFHIHLPLPDCILASETARLVLIFRRENEVWKIVHSGISIAYGGAREGEVYPLQNLSVRNRELEALVETRTLELEAANRKLEHISNTDSLTGIANRRHFDQSLQLEWNRAARGGSALGLILFDVDFFKLYNDRYGHPAGDRCLQALAAVLGPASRRAGDMAARYGGEEFVILLPGASASQAVEVAQRVQREIWKLALPHVDSATGIVTVSIGVASLQPMPWVAPAELVRQADVALYRAKQAGRNQIQSASAMMGVTG
ncbi:MAG: diguanylate cyclase [Burkholderiaceae bacterium]